MRAILITLLLVACDPGPASPKTTNDADGDGFVASEDCDDADRSRYPGAPERCNGIDDDCDDQVDEAAIDRLSWYADEDGDGWGDDEPKDATLACDAPRGYVSVAGDCDDNDPDINPDTRWYADLDGDGFGAGGAVRACEAPAQHSANADDCNDNDDTINPNAQEICDQRDDDCDGLADDADSDVLATTSWWLDADGDGFGDPSITIIACARPSNYAINGQDCNDSIATVNPNAAEDCATADDDNCNGDNNDLDAIGCSAYFPDNDGDQYGNDANSACLCTATSTHTVIVGGDCDDNNIAINPDTVWYFDGDGDGFGFSFSAITSCLQPSGYALSDADCDDQDPFIYPGAIERCNGLDDDCDANTPDGGIDNQTTPSPGVLTIQAAIDAASEWDTLLICPGVWTENLRIDKGLYLSATGGAETTLDGGGAGPVLSINTSSNVTLSFLTISGGAGSLGGGIANLGGGALTLDSTTVRGNVATDGAGVWSNGDLWFQSVVVTNNIASRNGGGIYLDGSFVNSSFGANEITGNNAQYGGGVFVADSSLNDLVVKDNTAAFGGGVAGSGTFSLYGLSLSTNTATTDGGAVWADADAMVSLGYLSVDGNRASLRGGGLWLGDRTSTQIIGSAIVNGAAVDGAGVYLGAAAFFDGASTSIDSNTASSKGGGMWVSSGSNVFSVGLAKNSADQGGGVYLDNASLDGATLNDNSSSLGGGVYANIAVLSNNEIISNTAQEGAGIYVEGAVSATNCSIQWNSVSPGVGGGITISLNSTFEGSYIFFDTNMPYDAWPISSATGIYLPPFLPISLSCTDLYCQY